ncbi:hypothetical protein C5Z26_06735 [Lactobacillus sp. CBA3606]|uniref:class I SAM-dependent methyltransferase n=1 Tax=Lactobacillus sp. CBA3606 TaxID=2099789 RepID=UPI000CFDFDFE|nr:class I SAM-dependent methyltransferase [Lactobacillus sp. CBA3606]AVK63822.1 hypothetical protein C5Z26_06735 [Lactobacillus sp. CBA3606]
MRDVRRYGIETPWLPVMSFFAIIFLGIYDYFNWGTVNVAIDIFIGLLILVENSCFLYTAIRGKYVIYDQLVQQIPLDSAGQVLDLGCGQGGLLARIAKQLTSASHVTGIDSWHRGTPAATQKNLDELGVADRATLVIGKLTTLPFETNQFDVIVSGFALHQIKNNQQREQAVHEAIRVLKPGGQLLIVDTDYRATQYRDVFRSENVQIAESKLLGINGWWAGPFKMSYLVRGIKAK